MFPQSKNAVIACSSGGVSVVKEFLGSLSSAVLSWHSVNVIDFRTKLFQSCLTLWCHLCYIQTVFYEMRHWVCCQPLLI